MSATPSALDLLLARAKEAVRQADAARVAKAKAKDGRLPTAARAAAQAEYAAWADALVWSLTAKERLTTRWTCRCGHAFESEVVQFFCLYEHRTLANATREVACAKADHPQLPVRMRTLERHTDYCTRCS